MTQAQPTPLPWDRTGASITTSWGNNGQIQIAKTVIPEWHKNMVKGADEAVANATFIVTACNAYYTLTEQRDELLKALIRISEEKVSHPENIRQLAKEAIAKVGAA